MEKAKNLQLENYSAIVAVGGDGTCHEVVNGLMYRKDGKKLPVCFLPNGSGNDLCNCLGQTDFDKGLDSLVKRDSIKIDIFKILLDHENEDQIKGD